MTEEGTGEGREGLFTVLAHMGPPYLGPAAQTDHDPGLGLILCLGLQM